MADFRAVPAVRIRRPACRWPSARGIVVYSTGVAIREQNQFSPPAKTRAKWGAMRLRLVALAAFFLFAVPAVAAADELARLNAQIMNDPANLELNLRYARAAEDSGQADRALAAYERVLVYDPGNVEAQSGLNRVRARILPPVTELFTEFGIGWDSNPH